MDDVEQLSFEEQRALQEERLPAQIERVRAGSSFYAGRFGEQPVRSLDELAELPFVTKAELLAAQAEAPPLGDIAAVPQERIARLHITSGTTGTPLMIGFTASDLARSSEWQAGFP